MLAADCWKAANNKTAFIKYFNFLKCLILNKTWKFILGLNVFEFTSKKNNKYVREMCDYTELSFRSQILPWQSLFSLTHTRTHTHTLINTHAHAPRRPVQILGTRIRTVPVVNGDERGPTSPGGSWRSSRRLSTRVTIQMCSCGRRSRSGSTSWSPGFR